MGAVISYEIQKFKYISQKKFHSKTITKHGELRNFLCLLYVITAVGFFVKFDFLLPISIWIHYTVLKTRFMVEMKQAPLDQGAYSK